jgi:hypothetical protein
VSAGEGVSGNFTPYVTQFVNISHTLTGGAVIHRFSTTDTVAVSRKTTRYVLKSLSRAGSSLRTSVASATPRNSYGGESK